VKAGEELARVLGAYKKNALVVGIAPGGVVVAAEVAGAFQVALEVVAPQPVLDGNGKAVGFVSGEVLVGAKKGSKLEEAKIEEKRLLSLYRDRRGPHSFLWRTVLLIGDGTEVEKKVEAAVKEILSHKPTRLILGFVAMEEGLKKRMGKEVDEVVVLDEGLDPSAAEVNDEEVQNLLKLHRR
jgi:predicted phosphoribosyltransferase